MRPFPSPARPHEAAQGSPKRGRMSQNSSRKPGAFQRQGASRRRGRSTAPYRYTAASGGAGRVMIPRPPCQWPASRLRETPHDDSQTRARPRPRRPRRRARPGPGEARLGHPRPHPRRGLPPLAGDGDGGAADRRPRPAPDRLAAVQEGGRLVAAAARDVGPGERPPGELAVRPRLELRALLGARRLADELPAGRAAQGLDRGDERPGARQGAAGQGRVGGGRRGPQGQGRGDGPLGGPAARAQGRPRTAASSSGTPTSSSTTSSSTRSPARAAAGAAPGRSTARPS